MVVGVAYFGQLDFSAALKAIDGVEGRSSTPFHLEVIARKKRR